MGLFPPSLQLTMPSFFLRELGRGSRPTGKTGVLAQKCKAPGNVYYISILWDFIDFCCVIVDTYLWQHLAVALSHYFITHRCLPASTGLMTVWCKDSLTPSSITHQYWWELSTLWASIPDLKFSVSAYIALGVYPRSVLQLWQEHKAKAGVEKVNCIRYTNLK